MLKNLLELNPDVAGEATVQDPVQFFREHRASLGHYSLVLCDGLSFVLASHQHLCCEVNAVCAQLGLKQVALKVLGQVGYLRLFEQHFTSTLASPAFQPKHDGEKFDLRLVRPFEALAQIVDSYHLEAMSEADRKKVPFLVILAQTLARWLREHGTPPSTPSHQQQLRALLEQQAAQLAEEENYSEALAYLGHIFRPAHHVPEEVQQALDLAVSLQSTEPFWLCVRALQRFIEEHHRCPLS